MADLGRAALVTAFLLLVYALVAGSLAAWQKRRRLAESAQNALLAAFGATLVASAVLLAALARHDFSFQYVADHTSHELPLGYTLINIASLVVGWALAALALSHFVRGRV